MQKRQLLITLGIFFFLILGTIIVVLYGKGYRFGLQKGRVDLSGTGLLVATSTPDGAQVFINDHLTTATDNTINLVPGEYTVRIYKDGYSPWQKRIKIENEVVSKAEALLFPKAPNFESLTSNGVGNPTLDPSQTRLAYTVASQSARKNGIYILDMTSRPVLTLQSASTQIVDDTSDIFSKASLQWSPDGRQLVATMPATLRGNTTYLLEANSLNTNPKDVTEMLQTVDATWKRDATDKQQARLASLKKPLKQLITENFQIVAWSPDDTKILYAASQSSTLALVINPRLIGVNSTNEDRAIKQGQVYVYDSKEDRNYELSIDPAIISRSNHESIQWFPDSRHLILIRNRKIDIMEYDGDNTVTIYAGPFIDNYVFPWPNASKLVLLTHLGDPESPANLYTIDLK